MAVQVSNPYRAGASPWLRANLHAHTTRSDGAHTPQALVDAYAGLGYDVLAISDHDLLTDPGSVDARGLVLIPANEITANGPHVQHLGAQTALAPAADRQQVLDAIGDAGGLAVLNHPNWGRDFDHCPFEQMARLQGYHGVEIFNAIVMHHEGSPIATGKWDRLLGAGRRLWGFANDDTHDPELAGLAWNRVQCAGRTPAAVLDALRHGRFHASTGVDIAGVEVCDTVVHLRAPNAQRIVALADYGRRIATADADHITVVVPDDTAVNYLRFECYGQGDARAWSQPLFVEHR